MIILSAGKAWNGNASEPDEARLRINELHAEMAAARPNSEIRVVKDASHGSIVHDQKAAESVSTAIFDLMDRIK